jgi:hypothetical protein
MESVSTSGWQGIYERDVSPWASVNYPPISLYTFWASEQLYQQLPPSLSTMPVHAALYKLPSMLADCLIVLLIWVFSPASKKWRAITMAIFLFNPALIINSVFWGQIESLSALFTILAVLALIHRQSGWAILCDTYSPHQTKLFTPHSALYEHIPTKSVYSNHLSTRFTCSSYLGIRYRYTTRPISPTVCI